MGEEGYCYNCNADDYDEEDEFVLQEEQRRKKEAEEQRSRLVKEKTQGKMSIELENIVIFGNDGEPDVKIAAINNLDVFSSDALRLVVQYDGLYSVREAAKTKLHSMGRSSPQELSDEHLKKIGTQR